MAGQTVVLNSQPKPLTDWAFSPRRFGSYDFWGLPVHHVVFLPGCSLCGYHILSFLRAQSKSSQTGDQQRDAGFPGESSGGYWLCSAWPEALCFRGLPHNGSALWTTQNTTLWQGFLQRFVFLLCSLDKTKPNKRKKRVKQTSDSCEMIQYVYFDRHPATQAVQTWSITINTLYRKVNEKDRMKRTV